MKKGAIREYIGKTGRVELEGMVFEVVLSDYKSAYGRDLVQIKPKRGAGFNWIRADRLTVA